MSGSRSSLYIALGLIIAAAGGAAAVLLQAKPAPAPALPADTLQAALLCRDATVLGQEPLPRETEIQGLYFQEQAARALPGNGDYHQRISAIVEMSPPGVSGTQAQIREACDRRWPLARRTGPVTLPASAWDRDLICVAATMSLAAYAEGNPAGAGGPTIFDRARTIGLRYRRRVEAGRAAHGLSDDSIVQLLGDARFASLQLGNVLAITTACERQEPDG